MTFSVTWCVRSMSLQGAMMSISPVGSAINGSGLKSTKFSVIWGILEMARYRMRSESEVEFSMLDLLFTAPANTRGVYRECRTNPRPSVYSFSVCGPTHQCCPAGRSLSDSFVPSRASSLRSRLRKMRAACCESFPASGCVTKSS